MRYVFDGFGLDPELFELAHADERVALEPQAFDVLVHLLRSRDRVVSKEELMDSVWGGRFVTESAVTSRIKQVRRALGDDGEAQRLIRTVHGRGYRFVGDVAEVAEDSAPAPAAAQDGGRTSRPEPAAPAAPLEPAGGHGNLVASLTPLVGREADLAAVRSALESHRLVTLLGTGGIGKTRLALEVARSRDDGDGPWFVELTGLREGSLLAEAVGSALGIPSALDAVALAGILADRELLLVLDNCEHLASEVSAFVVTLLQRCPHVRVLATSRQTLAVPGELLYDLHPLAAGDAERLFLDRATLAAPGWVPDADERTLLTRVCSELDHLPLAIELAAAQCRALSIDQLDEELTDRFTVLRSAGAADERHGSMTATVQWSFDTLSDAERRLFEALCLFEGTFDLNGVDAVSEHDPARTDTLLALINKSLVTVLPASPRRYRILETLREFAAQQRTAERTAEVRELIVRWVAVLAGRAEVELNGPRSQRWMERLAQDKETIRAAIGWLADEPSRRLPVAVGFMWFWYRRGHSAEALQALEPLSLVRDGSAPPAPSVDGSPLQGIADGVLLRAAVWVVLLRYLVGDHAQLPCALDQVGAYAERASDASARSFALSTLGFFDAAQGNVERGLAAAEEALTLAERLGSDELASSALLATCMARLRGGALDEAVRVGEASVARAEACGYRWGAVAAGWLVGKTRITAGDFSDATVAGLVRVVRGAATSRDITSWVVALVSLAYCLLQRGAGAQAAELAGIAGRQGELVGYAPERMDPVESGQYLAELHAALPRLGLERDYATGRGLTRGQAFARVEELLDAVGVLPDDEQPPRGPGSR